MGKAAAPRFYRPELDVVRFVAFLAVFLSHGLPSSSTNTNAGALVRACALGLPLFFCLSAYLITKLLLLERDRTGTVALPKFYKRRILRIWPLYLSMLAISAAISALHHTIHQTALWYVAALFMLANTVWWIRTTVSHLWSISIEEQFYLFWPAAVSRLSDRALALAACALAVLANAVLFRYGMHHAEHDGRIWGNTFVQLQFFAAGILLALYHHTAASDAAPSLLARPVLFVGALLAWFAAVRFLHALGDPGEFATGPLTLCCGYFIAVLGCVAILIAVQGWSRWPPPLVYLGKISYGLYVFHAIALGVADRFLLRFGRAASVSGAFFLTVAIAACSYHFFEARFLRLKERFEVVQSRPVGA